MPNNSRGTTTYNWKPYIGLDKGEVSMALEYIGATETGEQV